MTPIFTTVLFIGAVISISLVVIIITNLRRENKSHKLTIDFYKMAAEFNFFASKQESIGKSIIAVDDFSNRMLFYKADNDKRHGYLVELDELKSVAVKRDYALIRSDFKYSASIEPYVRKITLQLNYKTEAVPLEFTFYDKAIDSDFEMRERAAKAIEWQALLTNRLNKVIPMQGRQLNDQHLVLKSG